MPQNPMPDTQIGCFSGLFKRRATRRRTGQDSRVLSDEVKAEGALRYEGIEHKGRSFGPCCNFSCGPESEWWYDPEVPPSYSCVDSSILEPGVSKTIENKIDDISSELRELSMKIHGHPELLFQEKFAHDLLTDFMSKQGFHVTKHYLGLDTAWRAEFTHGKGGRVLGINSEMDALAGIGHACGHNLIAVSGVGVAIAVKAALQTHNVPGKVVLLGTPAEEGGGGKVILLKRGGYKDMDVCIMCHPSSGVAHSASTGSTNALQSLGVEYFGQTAHAGAAPWEGINALDAAFLAYSNISALRQQMKPDYRVHGIVEGKDWSPNVIPDYAKLRWLVRAPNIAELTVLSERVKSCFHAASMATGCEMVMSVDPPYYDLRQNEVLARDFSQVVQCRYGMTTNSIGTTASTDFGNVTYELPSLHPLYAIPTEPQGGNHTPAFTKSAATIKAHNVTMSVTKGLAHTGFRVLDDTAFFEEIQGAFNDGK